MNFNTDWVILYKLTTDNAHTSRHPAVYMKADSTHFIVHHAFNASLVASGGDYLSPTWLPSVGSWYFAATAVNLIEKKSNLTIIVPSKFGTEQFILLFNSITLASLQTEFSYTSEHKLYLGSDSQYHNIACIGIWNPFMITGYTPPTDDAILSLAFGIVPLSVPQLLLRPFEVYNNLFNYQDDIAILSAQEDPELFWSTNLPSYSALTDVSFSAANLSSIKGDFSFTNVNRSLSISMRMKYMINNHTSDTCSIYWLIQRISGGVVTFGIGIDSTGAAVIQIGST